MKNLLTICFLFAALTAFSMPQDSIGVKTVDGKTYIMHKVTKGEGVYGIGKKYGVAASDIYAANSGSEKSIQIGQVLLIPKSGIEVSKGTNTSSGSTASTKTEKIYHTVGKGQTLSWIAREYKTTVAEIKSLNNLKSDNINLGQKLLVGEKKIVVETQTKPVAQNQEQKQSQEPEAQVEKKPEPKPQPKPTPSDPIPAPSSNNVVVNPKNEAKTTGQDQIINTYSTDDGDEINESGMAIISDEGDLSQERSFIFHPTAKIGTIVMITNPANNNTVFARVVGNCKPESGTILKMSKTVATKLGISQNSEVKLSYAK